MAHKKGSGKSLNGRDSAGKRLGVKKFGGEIASTGQIIIRQRGTKFKPGLNVGCGKDHTLFALCSGFVVFSNKDGRKFVNVESKKSVEFGNNDKNFDNLVNKEG